MQNDHDVQQWHSRVPPGAPGAGWFIAVVFAVAAVTFGSWLWQGSHRATAAPASSSSSSHHPSH